MRSWTIADNLPLHHHHPHLKADQMARISVHTGRVSTAQAKCKLIKPASIARTRRAPICAGGRLRAAVKGRWEMAR